MNTTYSKTNIPTDLELIHIGGERRTVHVEYATNTRLGFRWGMAGMYELIVKKNTVFRVPAWKAVDREAAIKIWMEMTGRTRTDLLETSYWKHQKSMPK